MINCEIELILTWPKSCALANMTVRAPGNNNDPLANIAPTGLDFQIKDTKLYVPVVTLSKGNDKKLSEQLKSGFKRTAKWNKHGLYMTIQSNNNNLIYLIDPRFTKVNKLFVLSFAVNAEGDDRDSFSHYSVRNVRINNFNVLIDGKNFFHLSVKNEEEA